MNCRAVLIAAVFAVTLVACSDSTPTEAGSAPNNDGGQPVLQAVLEPANALMADPGEGWAEVDRWYTEGAMTHWGTGCSGFDRLGDIFNQGTPQTVVWVRDDDQLFQRTDDFGWDAGAFIDVVEQVPAKCPTVETSSTLVSVTDVSLDTLGPAVDRITEGDPAGRVAAIAFDAFPEPSRETDLSTPEFEAGGTTWMVVATRHNVVSQMVYGPVEGSGPGRLPELVAAQIDALLSAPVEATGPFEQAAPPPSVEPGTAADVELFVDPLTCSNDGFVEDDGIGWALTEPIPYEWRDRNPIVGDLVMDGTTASFTAHPGPPPIPGEAQTSVGTGPGSQLLDGFTVALTTGAVPAFCALWEAPDDEPTTTQIGQLDCDDRPIEEVVTRDAGQAIEDLAFEADPQTVEIRSDGPLQWSGLDGGGRVIVAIFLGDTDEPDWQVFTCSKP